MRHQVSGRKLNRTTSHRLAMLKNMATSLFKHERITTTVQKAKELRPFAEKLITLAKKETLHARRMVLRQIREKDVVKKLFETIGVRFATRPGGYTRIIKIGFRQGDNAEMAIIELVGSEDTSKPKKKAAAKKAAAKKTVAKKAPATDESVTGETEALEAAVEETAAETEDDIAEAEVSGATEVLETVEDQPAAEEKEKPQAKPEEKKAAAEEKAEETPAEKAKEEKPEAEDKKE